MMKFLGKEAELCFIFERGDKCISVHDCVLTIMPNGGIEVTCPEKLELEATMYKEQQNDIDSKYLVSC